MGGRGASPLVRGDMTCGVENLGGQAHLNSMHDCRQVDALPPADCGRPFRPPFVEGDEFLHDPVFPGGTKGAATEQSMGHQVAAHQSACCATREGARDRHPHLCVWSHVSAIAFWMPWLPLPPQQGVLTPAVRCSPLEDGRLFGRFGAEQGAPPGAGGQGLCTTTTGTALTK